MFGHIEQIFQRLNCTHSEESFNLVFVTRPTSLSDCLAASSHEIGIGVLFRYEEIERSPLFFLRKLKFSGAAFGDSELPEMLCE